MRSGPLRHRLTILVPVHTKDSGGTFTSTYTTVATRWGSVEPLTSRERLIAGQPQTRVTGRIRLRYFDGLTTRHRITHGDRTFEIVGVTNPDERGRETLCDVLEVA